MNAQSNELILVKKLISVIEEFLRNHYLKSFGYSKKKLDDLKPGQDIATKFDATPDEEEEYYYDEEEPTPQEEKKQVQAPQI